MANKEALEWFEYRLKSTKTQGANFIVPINWSVYGPLFLELFRALYDPDLLKLQGEVFLGDPGAVRNAVKAIDQRMKLDLNR